MRHRYSLNGLISLIAGASAPLAVANGPGCIESNFEELTTDNWTFAGDVAEFLPVTDGPCGAYLQFTDAGLGPTMLAIAPPKFHGDWSDGDGVGSVSFALGHVGWVAGGNPVTGIVLRISGQGGTARAAFQAPEPFDWKQFGVNLDPNEWTMESGTWETLLSEVTSMTINVEWSTGLEITGLDKVTLCLDQHYPPLPGDVDRDADIDVADLLLLLSAWGECEACDADINNDNLVDVTDLLLLLSNWGTPVICE